MTVLIIACVGGVEAVLPGVVGVERDCCGVVGLLHPKYLFTGHNAVIARDGVTGGREVQLMCLH